MDMMTKPGQPAHDAWESGCTCSWLRGFGVGRWPEIWEERIISRDPTCPFPHNEEVKGDSG